MAAKKLKKVTKKPAPRKLTPKKPAAKKASLQKRQVTVKRAAVKKVTAKKLTPKKAPMKLAPKKLAVAAKPAVKKHEPSAAARKIMGMPIKKMAAARPTAAVRKPIPKAAAAAKDPTKDYRNLRKYTHLKLEEIAQSVAEIRATIKSDGGDAPLAAWELTTYLAAIEIIVPDWKLKKLPAPDGKPRKRGRPSKADIAARSGAPMVLQTKAQATTAMAKVKTFVAKAGVPSLASPNITTGAALPVRPLLKLVPKLAPKLVSPAN